MVRSANHDRRATNGFGFPEVKLGLFPGWGGTARTPRMLGLANAVELVTGGETIDARTAAVMGLANDVVRTAKAEATIAARGGDPNDSRGAASQTISPRSRALGRADRDQRNRAWLSGRNGERLHPATNQRALPGAAGGARTHARRGGRRSRHGLPNGGRGVSETVRFAGQSGAAQRVLLARSQQEDRRHQGGRVAAKRSRRPASSGPA